VIEHQFDHGKRSFGLQDWSDSSAERDKTGEDRSMSSIPEFDRLDEALTALEAADWDGCSLSDRCEAILEYPVLRAQLGALRKKLLVELARCEQAEGGAGAGTP
jgi:hypothetical protein